MPNFSSSSSLAGYWLRCARLQSGRLPNREFLIYRFVGSGGTDGVMDHAARTSRFLPSSQDSFSALAQAAEVFRELVPCVIMVYRVTSHSRQPGCSRATWPSAPSDVVAGVEGCSGCPVVWAKAPDANANAETKVTAAIRERISALLRNPPFCNVQTIGGRQPRT